MHSIAVFDVCKAYGGSEEGGWWFDAGQLETSPELVAMGKFVETEQEAMKIRDEIQKVLGSSAYLVQMPGFTGCANESIESASQSLPVIRPCSMPSARWSRPSFRLSKFSHRPTRWCL